MRSNMYLYKKFRKKGPRKRRKPSPYKAAMDLLDTVFSFYIRMRDQRRFGKCAICLTRPIEVVFHFYPRKNMALRHEPDACCGSCRGCNYEEHMRRGIAESDNKFRAVLIRLVGEARVKELDAMKHQEWKKSAAELVEMKREIEEKMSHAPGGMFL